MAPDRTIVIGGKGQLGTDIVKMLPGVVTSLTSRILDIRDIDAIKWWVDTIRPHVVINTAAFHDLNRCEEDPQTAFDVNAVAVKNLADVCDFYDATLVHFSTDYVFGGDRGWGFNAETDPTNPINIYGISKRAGELVAFLARKYYVLRVSSLYGHTPPSGKSYNFPSLMLKLGRENGKVSVVSDQQMTPTFTLNVAKRLNKLWDQVPYGIYHFSDLGMCTWHAFVKHIFKIKGMDVLVEPVGTEYFPSRARRPQNTALCCDRISKFIGAPPTWEESIEEYLREVK